MLRNSNSDHTKIITIVAVVVIYTYAVVLASSHYVFCRRR